MPFPRRLRTRQRSRQLGNRWILALATSLLFALPSDMTAQVLRGRVLDAGTTNPVTGALVLVIDSAGRRVSSVLTNDQGAFQLSARTGRLVVRVEMIGRRSLSTELTLAPGAIRDLTLELPLAPIVLRGINVKAAERCDLRSASLATETVWEEARKALTVEAAVREQGLYRFDITRFERSTNESGRVTSERARFISRYTGTPFTSRPAEQLALQGYREERAGETYLFGPNGDVLLSNSFLDTHCFFLRRDGDHRGQIGLAFEPVRGRELTDIEGVLWLDEQTSELRSLEFSYTRMPRNYPRGRYGGNAEFQRLPNGAVIIREWQITSPIVQKVDQYFENQRITNDRVVGTYAEGGEVLNVIAQGDRSTALTGRATLLGMVFDSASNRPAFNAEVTIEGTDWSARTDFGGGFEIPNLPSGKYSISFTFKRPDGWTYSSTPREIELIRGQRTELRLATGRETVGISLKEARIRETLAKVGQLYGNTLWENHYRMPTDSIVLAQIQGRVVDEATMGGIHGVLVSLEGTNLIAETDSLGRVPALDVVPGEYDLRTEHVGYEPHVASISLHARQIGIFEIRLKRRAATEAVPDTGITSLNAMSPFPLDTISVAARSVRLTDVGFYERKNESGLSGFFITREEIERRNTPFITDLIDDAAGVRVMYTGPGKRTVRFNRTFQGICEPNVYLDDLLYQSSSGDMTTDSGGRIRFAKSPSRVDNFDVLPVAQIEGLEVYVGAATPTKYNNANGCGVILFWTRKGA
jgi:hypothetical protein